MRQDRVMAGLKRAPLILPNAQAVTISPIPNANAIPNTPLFCVYGRYRGMEMVSKRYWMSVTNIEHAGSSSQGAEEVDLRSLGGTTGDGIGASDGEVQEHGRANEFADRRDVPSLEVRDHLAVTQVDVSAGTSTSDDIWHGRHLA